MEAKAIIDAVLDFDQEKTVQLVRAHLEQGEDVLNILDQALIAAMDEVGRQFNTGIFFVPEMLMAAEAMRAGLEVLRPHLARSDIKAKGTIIIGTVKGDVHDIGKNIVGVVLQCNNFEVIDMGVMVPGQKILDKAKEENVDIIGLSGLITPSLDEMAHVAKEMQREGFDIPLLIGGATTSRVHTAVKIEPGYHGTTVYVKDASRAVGVAQNLVSEELKTPYVARIKEEYEQVRAQHAGKQRRTEWLTLEHARANKLHLEWEGYAPPRPAIFDNADAMLHAESTRSSGLAREQSAVADSHALLVFENQSLEELTKYIDWTPFFKVWELAGSYPKILDDDVVGEHARQLFDDAKQMLKQIIDQNWLQARAVVGLFPANQVGDDDIELYTDDSRSEVLTTLHHLRQQNQKPPGRPNQCLADFVAPKDTGLKDYLGAFAVTAGLGIDEHVQRFEADHDDYHSIMLKALADRLAEAYAELLHVRVRKEYWGYASEESLSNQELIKEAYTGIRPAPGYPACPEIIAFLYQSAGCRIPEQSLQLPFGGGIPLLHLCTAGSQ